MGRRMGGGEMGRTVRVRIPRDLEPRIDAHLERLGITISDLVRTSIKLVLDAEEEGIEARSIADGSRS